MRSKFGMQVSIESIGRGVMVNLRKRYDLDIESGKTHSCSVGIFD